MPQTNASQAVRLIKKYPNRRLYDTESSSYITLADVKQLVLGNAVFQVVDAKSGEDLTRSILLQIILEEESGGVPMFSANALAQIIRFYGHAMQGVMGTFLEQNLQTLMEIQNRMAEQSQGLYQQHFGPEAWTQLMNMQTPALQDMMNHYIEQSRDLFVQMQDRVQDQTRNMFSGFAFPQPPAPGQQPPAASAPQSKPAAGAQSSTRPGVQSKPGTQSEAGARPGTRSKSGAKPKSGA